MSYQLSAVDSQLKHLQKSRISPKEEQQGTKRGARRVTGEGIAAAALIAAGILTFPFAALPLGPPGIDSGWQWVVNTAADHGWIFGQNVVFTYGPLGWLATPQDVGHHLLLANGFRCALQVLFVISGLTMLARTRRPVPILVFAVLWTVASAIGLRFEGFVFLVVALLMLVCLRTERMWPAVTAGLITGIVPYIKTSLGLAAAATVAVGVGLIWKHRGFKLPVLATTVSGTTAALLAIVLFPSLDIFRAWIGQAMQVVDGYAAAASIIGPRTALVAGALLLLGVIAGGAFLILRTPNFGSTALILVPSLLITFRLAFVRQDGHQYLFVPYLVALLGVAALGTSRRPAVAMLATGLFAAIVGTLTGALPFGLATLPRIVTVGHRGPANIVRIANLDQTLEKLDDDSKRNLEPLKLPESWTDSLRSSANGITVIPWELMYAPANDLAFQPLRTMQLYSAYTSTLDQLTAEGLTGPTAPNFVLDDFAPVGKRRALLDAPATWRTLFLGYQLELSAQDRPLLLLSRRSEPLVHQWRDLGTTTLEVGGPGISVPASPHMVFAEIDAPLNTFGRLNKAFFRVPLLMAIFHRVDGTSSWARLIPATATAGILVSHFPHDIDDYAGLWSGRGPVAVSRLQIAGPGVRNYAKRFTVRWKALATGNGPGPQLKAQN